MILSQTTPELRTSLLVDTSHPAPTLANKLESVLRDLLALHQSRTIPPDRLRQAGIPTAHDIEIELRRREAVAA